MSDKPELKPCQNSKCALHGNKGNKCLYWGDEADVESCCCYSADLAKPSEEVKRLEDRIEEVEAENFNLMVDSFDFVPTNTHLKLVKKCKELEQAKPSEWISVGKLKALVDTWDKAEDKAHKEYECFGNLNAAGRGTGYGICAEQLRNIIEPLPSPPDKE